MFHLTGVLLSGMGSKLAYLDPGSGSILVQLLLAVLLGAGLALRASWGKIKGLFGKKSEPIDDEDDSDD